MGITAPETRLEPIVATAVETPRRVETDATERVNRLEVVVRYVLYIVITLFLFTPFVMTVLSSLRRAATRSGLSSKRLAPGELSPCLYRRPELPPSDL